MSSECSEKPGCREHCNEVMTVAAKRSWTSAGGGRGASRISVRDSLFLRSSAPPLSTSPPSPHL